MRNDFEYLLRELFLFKIGGCFGGSRRRLGGGRITS